jgi:hypothetical protein
LYVGFRFDGLGCEHWLGSSSSIAAALLLTLVVESIS